MAQYSFERVRAGYMEQWNRLEVVNSAHIPNAIAQATAQARKIIANKIRYRAVEARTGIPWFVIGCLHMRESNANFSTWLHNGDPMRNKQGFAIRTTHVPAGRPPNPDVSWEEGAYDALVTVQGLHLIKEWSPAHVAYASEDFNGWGYRNPSRNIPSPYLFGGTNIQKRGKFVRDKVYDAGTWDTQIGAMAVLKKLAELDPTVRFISVAPSKPIIPAALPVSSEPPASPKAEDTGGATVRPPSRSRTVWSGIISGGAAVVGAVSSAFAYVNNPYALAAFGVLAAVGIVGGYLVVRGYIDVRAVVNHLSQDEDEGAD